MPSFKPNRDLSAGESAGFGGGGSVTDGPPPQGAGVGGSEDLSPRGKQLQLQALQAQSVPDGAPPPQKKAIGPSLQSKTPVGPPRGLPIQGGAPPPQPPSGGGGAPGGNIGGNPSGPPSGGSSGTPGVFPWRQGPMNPGGQAGANAGGSGSPSV